MIKILFKVGSIISILFILLLFLSTCDITFSKREFDHKAWIEGNKRERGEMVHSLIESKVLDNMSKSGVAEFLGIKEAIEERKHIGIIVDIGHRFGFSEWDYALNIVFDQDDKVKMYYLAD
jgi:hypothetical protein